MRYHHIKVHINTDQKAPYYTGSMLRGTLGHALKRVTCINPSYKCEGCFAADRCLYYDMFEKSSKPHNYRLDIELGSGTYDFGVYLFGDTTTHLPYMLYAIQMQLTKYGMGKDRLIFDDFTIDVNSEKVYSDGSFIHEMRAKPAIFDPPNFSQPATVKITFVTPLRIKRANKIEFADITPEMLLRSIRQRYVQITSGETVHSLDYKPEYATFVKAIEHRKLYRKSSRQDKKLNIDGVVGEMSIVDLDPRSLKLLKIGELIGVGKQTVFGLGKVKVDEVDRK